MQVLPDGVPSGGRDAGRVLTLGSEVELPALVRHYLERALPLGGSVPRRVRVAQVGEMWMKPGSRPLRFTAVEELAVEEVAFSWRARFPILPLVSLRVVDRYAAGKGLLEARALRVVRVMRRRGQEVSEAEAMRYLAELAWVPHAMRANRALEWHERDEQTVDVATSVGSARVVVRLAFDTAGDIVGAVADARPHQEGRTSVRRQWGGSLQRLRGGRRHPRSDPRRGALGAAGWAVHLLARHPHLVRASVALTRGGRETARGGGVSRRSPRPR